MASRGRAWADTRVVGTALVAGTPLELNLLATAPVSDTLTVIRILVDLWVMYTTNVTVTDSLSIVDVGIGVASAQAFAVGGTALPNPGNLDQDPPRGWLYIASKPVQEKVNAEGIMQLIAHFQADLRAARKIDKGVLFLTMEQNNITVGGSMQVVGRVRALCLT